MKKMLFFSLSFGVVFGLGCSHKSQKKSEANYQGLGVESVSADDLKNYKAQKLPPSIENKISLILDTQTPGGGVLHPDGKTLFFSWRISGSSQVWKLNSPQGFPVQLTGGKDTTQVATVTPDGKKLVLQRDIDGQENPGIYLQSINGGPLDKIYHQDKVKATFQFVTDDSQWLYFTANDKTPDTLTLYKVNLNTKNKELVLNENGYWSVSDYKGSLLLLQKLTGSRMSEYYLYDEATKKLDPVFGQNASDENVLQFGAQDKTYLVMTSKIGNYRRLYLLKSGSPDLKPLSEETPFDVSSFSIDRGRRRILYEVNRAGYSQLKALDAKTFKAISVPDFAKADHVLHASTTRNARWSVISVITNKSPRISYTYDWNTQKATQWTLPSLPEIDATKFVAASLEYYTSKDGTRIPMFVRRPSVCAKKTCPVVVHFHGGPEGQSRAGFHSVAQLFVDEGIIFVEPNVRGSDGYGKEWLNADNAAKRLSVISDIQDVSDFIKKNWAYDGQTPKVGVMGWSYGGYATLFAMTKYAGTYDAGVSLVGISNLLTFLNNTAPYRRKLRASEYGDPEKDKEALVQLSPMTYVDQVKSPLMIIQGANDPRVPAGEAVQIQKILQSKKIQSELIIFPDEGHGSQKKENRILELGHALNFLVKNLKQ